MVEKSSETYRHFASQRDERLIGCTKCVPSIQLQISGISQESKLNDADE